MDGTRGQRETLIAVSFIAISLVLTPVLLQSVLFLAGIPLSKASFVIGLALGLCVPAVAMERNRRLWIAYAIVLVAVASALLVQGHSWDNSSDSLLYHEPAAISLAKGANPLDASLGNFWADHYPKAAWVFSGGMYALTGSIEYGKVVSALLMLACFGVAGAVFLSVPGLRASWAWVLAGVTAMNPVAVVQFDTHYVDGLFSSLATILILLAVAVGPARLDVGVSRNRILTLACASAVLLANLKFTGLVFVVALLIIQATWRIAESRGVGSVQWKPIAASLCAITAGILIVGFNPYVTNIRDHRALFYPLFSTETDVSKIPNQPDVERPVPYRRQAPPVAFLMSISDETSAATTETMQSSYRMKNPLTVKRGEILAMQFPDPRRGGFGPLFLLALILAALEGVLMLAWRKDVRLALPLGAVSYGVAAALTLTLLMIEAWWARLAPVFFMVPVLIAIGGLTAEGGPKGRILRAVGIGLVAIVCLNGLLALTAQVYDIRNRRIFRHDAMEAFAGTERLRVRFPDPRFAFHSGPFVQRLRDEGFEVQVVTTDGAASGSWVSYPALPGAEVAVE